MFIAIYKALIARLPARPALNLMQRLASRTQRQPINEDQRTALLQARRMTFGTGGGLCAWHWGTQGPLVLLVHGWNGSAAQLAPLASALARQGFRCVAIDVTGHGDSPGKRTSWRCFIDDIAQVARELGEVPHACIGHSAGGLAMMAARHTHQFTARHYVCICAPTHPHPPIRAVRQRLNPRPQLLEMYQDFIASQFCTRWFALASGAAFAGAHDDLLLIYDEGDRYVDHRDGDRIQNWCPGSTLVKPTSVGHSRVLATPQVQDAILSFIARSTRDENLKGRADGTGAKLLSPTEI